MKKRFGKDAVWTLGRPSDAEDLVTFYPALAASIVRNFLYELPEGAQSLQDLGHILAIHERANPYKSGAPEFSPRKFEKWHAEQLKKEEANRNERRLTELLYQLAPEEPGLLIDERLWWGKARTPDGIAWAENRVAELGFEKTQKDRVISYELKLSDYLVFADIRQEKAIKFFVYLATEQPSKRKVRRIGIEFAIPDNWRNDLRRKVEVRILQEGSRLNGNRR